MASVVKGLAALRNGETPADAPKLSTPPEAAPVETKPEAAEPEKLNDEPTVEKPAEKLADAPTEDDPKTARGLAAIEKREKRFREEQARIKADLELERAELARIKSELTGKATSYEDFKKLKPLDLIDKLGLDDDGLVALSRGAYARTKAGSADPRAAAAVAEVTEKRATKESIESIREEIRKEFRDELAKRDAAEQTKSFANKWQDDAVKAIPGDKPTLIARLHEKAPEKARAILLSIGQHLERENDNETPTHAEVIEAYEKHRRAELEEQGIDVDALLAPKKTAPPAAPTKTLDVTTSGGTRPITSANTKAEKIALVTAGLKKLNQ